MRIDELGSPTTCCLEKYELHVRHIYNRDGQSLITGVYFRRYQVLSYVRYMEQRQIFPGFRGNFNRIPGDLFVGTLCEKNIGLDGKWRPMKYLGNHRISFEIPIQQ